MVRNGPEEILWSSFPEHIHDLLEADISATMGRCICGSYNRWRVAWSIAECEQCVCISWRNQEKKTITCQSATGKTSVTHNLQRTVIWPLCLHNAPFFCVFVFVSHSECWSSHPHDLRLYGWVGFAQASFYSWHSFLYGTLSQLCVCFMCWHWNSIPSVCVRADLHTAQTGLNSHRWVSGTVTHCGLLLTLFSYIILMNLFVNTYSCWHLSYYCSTWNIEYFF